ncbi:MAG: hypothetical protein ACT4QC_21820 [Planctomycetaceae bacterium]
MQRRDKSCKEWADAIRKSLMTGNLPEVTKSIEAIRVESGTAESHARLSRPGPWTTGHAETSLIETIHSAGLEIACEPNAQGLVENVTFRLNATWRGVQKRFAKTQAP